MIATAIGKPIANAPKIAKVNSPSKLTGRTTFTDMLHSTKSEAKKQSPGRSSDGFQLAYCVQKPRTNGAQRWLTEY